MPIETFKLYQIASQYERALDQFLDDPNQADLLDSMKGSFSDKCIATAKYIKSREAEYNAMSEAAKSMTERAKKAANRIESLTEYLRYNIEKTGLIDAIICPEFDIKLAINPPALVIFDAELIPDMFKIEETVVKLDKDAIKRQIKDGFEVDGCKLESRKRLIIK